MQRIMKREDIVDELHERTGFFKKNLREIMDALEEVIVDNMKEADYDMPSEFYLAHGCIIGGKKTPEREARDPRNQAAITVPEKIVPYSKFKMSFRQRINK